MPTLEHVDMALREFSRVCKGKVLLQWNVRKESKPKNVFSSFLRLIKCKTGLKNQKPIKRPENIKAKYTHIELKELFAKNDLQEIDFFPLPDIKSSVRNSVLSCN